MRRWLMVAGAAALLAGPALADTRPKAPAPVAQDAFDLSIQEAGADLDKGDRAHAREVLERAWRSPAFAKAAPEMQHAVLLMIGGLASETKDWAGAKAALVPASEMAAANAIDWQARLEVAGYAQDKEDAVHALTVLAQRFPTALAEVSDDAISYWHDTARLLPDGAAKQFALADALFKAKWAPQDPFADLSSLRMTYVLGLIQHDRLDEARVVAKAVTDPENRIMMRADKRYDPLGDRQALSPKAGALARQAEVEALLPKNADRLSGQIAKAEVLLALHRPKDALATIEAALARASAAPDAFIDQASKLGWAYNVRNFALEAVGRRDDAVEALAAGARTPERGRPNVNQTLNLAIAQVRNAQPKAALATVGSVRLDLMSPYGRAVALQARVCAQAALNQRDEASAGLKDLRAIGDEAKNNTLAALLCLGDLDSAAVLLIERLRSETQRGHTLLLLQPGPPPDFPSAYDLDREAKLETLRKRPDVLAAVEPVGRIERYRPEDLWPTP